jgi:hypothetical protein
MVRLGMDIIYMVTPTSTPTSIIPENENIKGLK